MYIISEFLALSTFPNVPFWCTPSGVNFELYADSKNLTFLITLRYAPLPRINFSRDTGHFFYPCKLICSGDLFPSQIAVIFWSLAIWAFPTSVGLVGYIIYWHYMYSPFTLIVSINRTYKCPCHWTEKYRPTDDYIH